MPKIAYNTCYGGFGLSHAAIMRYAQLTGQDIKAYENDLSSKGDPRQLTEKEAVANGLMTIYFIGPISEHKHFSDRDIPRNDPALIQVIEELGIAANGRFASLALCDLPSGTQYRIDEYDGMESVMTPADYEWSIA